MNQPTEPSAPGNVPAQTEQIAAAVHMHQRKMKLLTAAAFLFGALTLLASLLIVSGYFVLYRPEQMQLMKDFGMRIQAAAPEAPADRPEAPARAKYDFPHIMVVMMHGLSVGTMMVAFAVGLCAAGTLVILALVVVQRRATLNQINTRLTLISEQLKQLRAGGVEIDSGATNLCDCFT